MVRPGNRMNIEGHIYNPNSKYQPKDHDKAVRTDITKGKHEEELRMMPNYLRTMSIFEDSTESFKTWSRS